MIDQNHFLHMSFYIDMTLPICVFWLALFSLFVFFYGKSVKWLSSYYLSWVNNPLVQSKWL